MTRLIDADALIDKYGDWYTEEGTEEGFIGTIKAIVDSLPTIDIDLSEYSDRLWKSAYERGKAEAVKRGKWIKADSQQYFRKHYPCFTCSSCGYRKESQKKWNYCPNCGARMDEE